jgi:hypothetical protein
VGISYAGSRRRGIEPQSFLEKTIGTKKGDRPLLKPASLYPKKRAVDLLISLDFGIW